MVPENLGRAREARSGFRCGIWFLAQTKSISSTMDGREKIDVVYDKIIFVAQINPLFYVYFLWFVWNVEISMAKCDLAPLAKSVLYKKKRHLLSTPKLTDSS